MDSLVDVLDPSVGVRPPTHAAIDPSLCGRPIACEPGRATVELLTTAAMAADALGLVHGGFVFGAADYAAMLAVGDPNVVLGAAQVRFSKPLRVGETVRCEAVVEATNGRQRQVVVTVSRGDVVVMTGSFTAFVLDRHVLVVD